MQIVSALYRTLQASGAAQEVKVVIAGVEYPQSKIVSLRTMSDVFQNGNISVGGTVVRQIDLRIMDPGAIPRMAEIRPYVRLVGDDGKVSEWIPKGVFFIDTRSVGSVFGDLTIRGYDSMCKTEQDFTTSGDQGTWPMKDIDAVKEICRRIGVALDSRTETIMTKTYDVQYPSYGDDAYTMREVLGYIGAMYAGNWVMSDEGKLMLICLADLPPETYYLTDEVGNVLIFGDDCKILV